MTSSIGRELFSIQNRRAVKLKPLYYVPLNDPKNVAIYDCPHPEKDIAFKNRLMIKQLN